MNPTRSLSSRQSIRVVVPAILATMLDIENGIELFAAVCCCEKCAKVFNPRASPSQPADSSDKVPMHNSIGARRNTGLTLRVNFILSRCCRPRAGAASDKPSVVPDR